MENKKKKEKKMNKLVIVLVAIAMTFGVNAASFNWKVTNVRIPVAADVTKDQTGIKVSTADAKFAAEALTLNLSYLGSDGTSLFSLASIANDGEGALSIHEAFDNTGAANVVANAGGTAVDFVLTAEYKTADGTYTFSQTLANVDIANVADNVMDVSKTFAMNNGSWDYTAKGGPGPVPEPTSGLLLILGMAGLALRRKQA